jgi:Lysyl oxidase
MKIQEALMKTTTALKTLVALLLCVFLELSPASAATRLTPDLQTLKPYKISVETTSSGERRLRFSNEVVNAGSGPLEVVPKSEDCNGDGKVKNDRTAYQRLYSDANGNGYFERGTDTSFTTNRAGCMVFHPAHHHWHFEDFADYELKRLADGSVVASSTKVTFCMEDSRRVLPNALGSPSTPYFTTCSRTSAEGISIGWSDIYGASLRDQFISIEGVPDRDYCLVSTADPSNKLIEGNDDNNRASTALHLSGNTVSVLDQAC